MSKAKYKKLIVIGTSAFLDGYDHRLIAAQAKQESAFKEDAVSPAGAQGVMQIMPATWQDLTKDANLQSNDPFNPHSNIMMGCKYMAQMLNGWTAPRPPIDRICLALASYNAGFGNLLKAQRLAGGANDYASIIAKLPEVTGHHAKETTEYVTKILAYYNEYVIEGWE